MTRRRTIRLLLALLLGAVGWAGLSLVASAGGPTSVLLVDSGGQAGALHCTEPDYDRLMTAVGDGATGDLEQPASTAADQHVVRLTWLIHDVHVWRIDTIHLTPKDGIWVSTVVQQGEDDIDDHPARWHRPPNGTELLAVLAAAGVSGGDPAPSRTPASTRPASTPVAAPAPAAPAGPEPSVPTAAAATPAVPLVATAALGGLVVGVVGSWLLPRPRRATAPSVTLDG